MTKQEFDLKYRGEKVAVHCDTEEKAKAFLSLAKSFGYKWVTGIDLEEYNFWNIDKENTCYRFVINRVLIDHKSYYISKSYTIVPFELDEPKETFNVGDVVYAKVNGKELKVIDRPYLVQSQDGLLWYMRQHLLTKQKPLKEITEKELAELGFVLKK